jgi:hypothetical protein
MQAIERHSQTNGSKTSKQLRLPASDELERAQRVRANEHTERHMASAHMSEVSGRQRIRNLAFAHWATVLRNVDAKHVEIASEIGVNGRPETAVSTIVFDGAASVGDRQRGMSSAPDPLQCDVVAGDGAYWRTAERSADAECK